MNFDFSVKTTRQIEKDIQRTLEDMRSHLSELKHSVLSEERRRHILDEMENMELFVDKLRTELQKRQRSLHKTKTLLDMSDHESCGHPMFI